MNSKPAELLQPSPADLAAIAGHVTGERALVRSAWDQIRMRAPELKTRSDVTEDFLVEAMAETLKAGLLEDLLFELATQHLTDGEPFLDVVEAALGHALSGSGGEAADAGTDDLLAMKIDGASPVTMVEIPALDALRAPFQTFLPKDAGDSYDGMGLAMDRVCRVVVDGVVRGSGVLVDDLIVVTSAHVIEPLVTRDAAGTFSAVEGSLARLELHFPRGYHSRNVASPARKWLLHYSPAATVERAKPFNVYDVDGISFPDGPWDVALIELARQMDHVRQGRGRVNAEPPEFRFQINVLHSPRAASRVQVSPGEYLGKLKDPDRLRLLHDAMTIPGSSGAPCFNADWEVVGIHQGGASDAAAERKVNRAIPAGAWLDRVEKAAPAAPIAWQAVVPAIDGAPAQPVIGRRRLQQRIHAAGRADAPALDRLFVIRGAKGRGKSFSIRLLQQLTGQGDVVCALDLEGMAGFDETRFAETVIGTLGDAVRAREQPHLSTREREVLNATLPDVVSRIASFVRDRQVWLAFDGYATAGLIESAGIGQFVDGLIAELDRLPQLRVMLADWTRPIPPEYAPAISDLDQSDEWPRLDDLVDYVGLRNYPPGVPMPNDVRALMSALLAGKAQGVLNQLGAKPPLFYADLLQAAQLDALVVGG
jgi:hypothetical protein